MNKATGWSTMRVSLFLFFFPLSVEAVKELPSPSAGTHVLLQLVPFSAECGSIARERGFPVAALLQRVSVQAL